MILNAKPLTLGEVQDYAKHLDESKPMHAYLKAFAKLSKSDAHKLFSELQSINNPKLRDSHLVKIVDFLPKDSEELNKIVPEAGLSEEEAQAIVEKTKQY